MKAYDRSYREEERIKSLTGQAVFPTQVKEWDFPCPVMASSAQSESAQSIPLILTLEGIVSLSFLVLP